MNGFHKKPNISYTQQQQQQQMLNKHTLIPAGSGSSATLWEKKSQNTKKKLCRIQEENGSMSSHMERPATPDWLKGSYFSSIELSANEGKRMCVAMSKLFSTKSVFCYFVWHQNQIGIKKNVVWK